MPSQPLDAKSESPKTTMRVSALAVSSGFAPAAGAGASVAGDDTAAASETGPGLSPLSSSRLTSLVVLSVLMSVSPQLFGLVSTSGCGNLPLVPPAMGATDLASRYAVSRLKRSVIGMRLVAGGDGRLGTGADQPAHAADVDDDVVADLDAPVLQQAGDVGYARRSRVCRADRA